MTNREHIDQINTFINNFFKQEKEEKGFVNREFFESEALKTKSRNALEALASLGAIPKINEDKFCKFYATAIKESRHQNQAGMTPSISLSSRSSKNHIWLTTVIGHLTVP